MENNFDFTNLPQSIEVRNTSISITLPIDLYCYYTDSVPGKDGFPQNGSLFEDGTFEGNNTTSFFDVTANKDANALLLISLDKENNNWKFTRENDKLTLILLNGKWEIKLYCGNEPDWNTHYFPFRNLPKVDESLHHVYIKGLLDFLAGTRRSLTNGVYFQSPNTSIGKGYSGDGIPDTFFQFISTYPFLDEQHKAFFRSQIDYLGNNMRFDNCIPWGGCRLNIPYYHLWKRTDCGMFFDANALYLEMTYLLYYFDNIIPDVTKVIRAADFYLHYSTENNLVAAESKKRGCEWADLLQNGWYSSIINVLAYRGLKSASRLMDVCQVPELAHRYDVIAERLKEQLNKDISNGGLFDKNGFIDWQDKDGTNHNYWRIDTHMLACIWDAATKENQEIILKYFIEEYFKDEPAVPTPYLLNGSWFTEERDDMIMETRSYGCGTASMPGRMAGPLIAALRKRNNHQLADYFQNKLQDFLAKEKAIYEYYLKDGTGCAARSYIEHSLVLLYAHNLTELYTKN